jgi:hypothetical protein
MATLKTYLIWTLDSRGHRKCIPYITNTYYTLYSDTSFLDAAFEAFRPT